MPPTQEAVAIVEALRSETRQIESAITTTLQEIKLIAEYRHRIVADVVTGKLDVRRAAQDLPVSFEKAGVTDDVFGFDDSDGLEEDPSDLLTIAGED